MTVHLVYPYGERKAAPWSIGNHLAEYLCADGHVVIQYDWEQRIRMKVEPGDILIGHPHENPGYAFTDNLWQPFAQMIAIAPWNNDTNYTQRLISVEDLCEIVAICGPKYLPLMPENWHRVDMALDPNDYPMVHNGIRPAGQRRILYVGCAMECKGVKYLTELSDALPDVYFGHIGSGYIPGTHPHGYINLESQEGMSIASTYDFLIAPGLADANPTTVLEAIALGLIPVGTDGAGWGSDVLINLPSDIEHGSMVLRQLTEVSSDVLIERRHHNLEALKSYTWDKFYSTIRELINVPTQRHGKHDSGGKADCKCNPSKSDQCCKLSK